jgi:hypothetical protein
MRSALRATLFVAIAALAIAAPPARAAEGAAPPLDVILVVDVSASVDGFEPGAIRDFLGALPGRTRLAVIAFAEGASLVRPLSELAGPADLEAAGERIAGLAFRGRHTELGEGLLLALAEGDGAERPARVRRVALLSDGRIDPAAGAAARAGALRTLRREVLPAFVAAGLPVFAVARGSADAALLREVSERTGGRSLLAPDGPALGDALALLAQGFSLDAQRASPPAAAPSVGAAPRAAPIAARRVRDRAFAESSAVAPVLAAALAAVAVALALAERRRRRSPPDAAPITEPAAAALRAQRLDLEDKLVAAWEAERAARDGQHRLADELFLVLDHLDRTVADGADADRLRWFRDKLERVLAGAGIEEIRVAVGDAFDGGVHRHVGERAAELPRGAVLAVTRKGYARRAPGGGGGARVLRPTEVVLSSGRTAPVN